MFLTRTETAIGNHANMCKSTNSPTPKQSARLIIYGQIKYCRPMRIMLPCSSGYIIIKSRCEQKHLKPFLRHRIQLQQ